MSLAPDPLTLFLARCGAYWPEAQLDRPIHGNALVVTRIAEVRPARDTGAPIDYARQGIVGERVAERPHNKPHRSAY